MDFHDYHICDIIHPMYNRLDRTRLSQKAKTWKNLIKELDLGIICISFWKSRYRIKDKKKWALAKIKYGF